MKNLRIRLCCVIGLITAGFPLGTSRADLVEIDFRDQNPPTSPFPNSGGPHWVGVVDTHADTLTINFWEEIPGSTQYWVPSLLAGPLVWSAVDSNGLRYDVPDTFGTTPQIGSNWGFLSPTSARNMAWQQGSLLLPESADYFPGWGGVRRPIVGQNPVALIYDMTANEHTMPLLPYNSLGLRASLDAAVSVNRVTVVAVPEASSFVAGCLLASLWAMRRGWQRWRG